MINFFQTNRFPTSLVYSKIKKFLHSKFNPAPVLSTVDKKKLFESLPYFGHQSEKLKMELENLLSKYFTFIDFKIVLVNKFTIGSLFRFKDRLLKCLLSSVVYKYCCAQCASEYVGSTTRSLRARVAEHSGRSIRTNLPLAKPPHSSIRLHAERCDAPVSIDNFTVLCCNFNPVHLRILESFYITKLKHKLNDMQSAYRLNIVNH